MNHELFLAALDELKTVRDLIRFGATCFKEAEIYFGHGTNNAWDEATALILHALHLPPDSGREVAAARLTRHERAQVLELYKARLLTRKAAAYLIHSAYFAGYEFYVDERVIIPRSPIAELIESQFNLPGFDALDLHSVLDMCTGSGCIAIATALHCPDVQVDAVDLSLDALDVAKINIEKYHLKDRVKLIQSDLFEQLPVKEYDLILCNPPYVPTDEYAQLPKEYLHEPHMALVSADDGLEVPKRILSQAVQYLSADGVLILEVGASARALQQAFPKVPFLWLEFARGGEGVLLLTRQELSVAKFLV